MKKTRFTHARPVDLDPAEKVLFDGYPEQFRFSSLVLFAAFLIIAIPGKDSLFETLLYSLLVVLIYGELFGFRMVITDQRILRIYPFAIYTQEVKQTDFTEPPYYIPPVRVFDLLKFKHWPQPDTPLEDIKKKAILHFPLVKSKWFAQMRFNLRAELFSKADQEIIHRALEQYWGVDPKKLLDKDTKTIREIFEVERQNEDIGKSPVILVFVAIALGAGFFFVPLDGVHFGIESYWGAVPAGLLALAICFPIIRLEKKKHPLVAAVMSSILLGASLYAISLQLNRYYNEKKPNHAQVYQLKLLELSQYSQVWTLPENLADETGLKQIYINKNWQGYNGELKVGQAYNVAIHHGLFKDYWLSPDAFKQSK